MRVTQVFSNSKVFVFLNALKKVSASIANIILVQSLNSPFFPPLIGAEPGRAKEESRDRVQNNLHAHAQNAAIFSPQIGVKTILACGAIF